MTNDGATILRAVGVDNPAAKVLVEMSRVQVFLLFSNGRRDFSLHGLFHLVTSLVRGRNKNAY